MASLPPPISHTLSAIDAAYVATARDGDSMGVPMSSVGHACDRYLWYLFRWAAEREAPNGQRQRIFKTGQIYERRVLDDLRAIGCDVLEIDETTGQQFRVELANGHLRGKVDGITTGIPEAPAVEHVVEIKSSNERTFKEIVKKGVQEAKFEHYVQCQMYMHGTGIHRAIYICANKNTDELHCERVKYDPALCLSLVARVERIVSADTPPQRLHDDPGNKAAFACGFCPARLQCHEGAFARINCRTCCHSTAHDGPKWTCDRHGQLLSYGDQQAACGDHVFLPGTVPGAQVDADPTAGTITYQMNDGSSWVDGPGKQDVAA